MNSRKHTVEVDVFERVYVAVVDQNRRVMRAILASVGADLAIHQPCQAAAGPGRDTQGVAVT